MKNLKKALCLVLALAMIFSLGAVASATDFADDDQITYTEAVEVMTGLGIIDGTDNNKFDPTGDFTREQAAKIISYMLLGETVADALKCTTAPYADVAASRWSAGYISYCASKGIIAGVGDNKFDPTGKLTTHAWLKMLLVALGYDAKENGLEGDVNWEINTASLALSSKLVSASEIALSFDREVAVLYAWNGLNYSKSGSSSEYIVTDKNGKTLYQGTDALTALIMKQADEDNFLTLSTTYTDSLGATVYDLHTDTQTDDFGRKYTEYNNGKTGSSKVIYAAIDPEAEATFTTATTTGKIAVALGYTSINDSITLNIITDGVKDTTAKTAVNKSKTDAVGGQGTLVEVYAVANATDEYDVIVINTYVKKLASTDITAANTTTEEAAYITLDSLKYETSAFKKDDVVLYTKGTSDGTTAKISNVVKADYISGKVTATAASYIRVDGVIKYLAANNAVTVSGIGSTNGYTVDASTTYTYYLDSYGNIILAVAGETEAPETRYTYLIATAARAAKTSDGGNLFESTETSAAAAQAKVIDLATGEIKVVNLGVVKGTDGKYYYANKNGAASSDEVTGDAPVSSNLKQVYKYVALDDGSYVLDGAATTQNVTLAAGDASIGVTGLVATSSTKLSVVTIKEENSTPVSAAVTTYTGIANFPTKTSVAAVVIDSDSIVSDIIIVTNTTTSTSDYAVFAGTGETDAEGTKVAFYVKGEKVEYYLAENVTLSLSVGDVVKVTLTNGVIASASDVAAAAKVGTDDTATVDLVDATFIVVTDNSTSAVWYLSDDVQVVTANSDGAYVAAELAESQEIVAYGTTDGSKTTVDFIVVQ